MKSSSNGDSQSDVRFLTSDEVLDFNLAHPDDDDDDEVWNIWKYSFKPLKYFNINLK